MVDADTATKKKRPRVDLLASLDAAFAAKKAAPASKYTAQAAVKEAEANSQQAYLHKKRKNKGGNKTQQQNGSTTTNSSQKPNNNSQQKNGAGSNSRSASGDGGSNNNSSNRDTKPQQAASDPLYGKLDVEILRVGLKNCSLLPQAKTLNKPYVLSATLKSYLETLSRESSNSGAAADKLKNKVLQLDNPIKTTDAAKNAHNYAQAQSAKLLGARQRRNLGLHLLKGEMKFSDAEQLCAIWRRYARDVIGTDGDDAADEVARNMRVQSKLRTMDLSGCPVEVVRSRNPCAIGSLGIVIAEKQQVLQICTPANKIITLPKHGSRFRVVLDDHRAVLIEGEWLLKRAS